MVGRKPAPRRRRSISMIAFATLVPVLVALSFLMWRNTKKRPSIDSTPIVLSPSPVPWLKLEGKLAHVDFSHDGRVLTTAGAGLKHWEVPSGKEVLGTAEWAGRILGLAFSLDGRWLAATCQDEARGMSLRVWSVDSFDTKLTFNNVYSMDLDWSPDGENVAGVNYYESKIHIWNVNSGRLVATRDAHEGGVYDVVWSPDGARIATCGKDKFVKVWDWPMRGKPNCELQMDRKVLEIEFSLDGKHLLAGTGFYQNIEATISIWNLESKKIQARVGVGKTQVNSLIVAPWNAPGKLIVTGCQRELRMWSWQGRRINRRRSLSLESTVVSLKISPDGSYIAAGLLNGLVHLYSFPRLTEIEGRL